MSTKEPQFSHEFDFAREADFPADDEAQVTHIDNDASYVCDSCGEEIVIPVDLAGGQDQIYVEDCPICCSPNVIHVRVEHDHVEIHAEPE